MTREEKQLLIKDLLPRQLYGVKAHYQYYDFVGGSERLIHESDGVIKSIDISLGNPVCIDGHHVEMENIKPYLRPMSSMTEKEQRYIWDKYGPSFLVADFEDAGDVSELFNYCQMNISRGPSFVDWLNEHHFDYRGLIPMGLALEAPENMYKTE